MEINQNKFYCFFSLKPDSSFPAKLSFKLSVWSHQKFVGISQYVHFSTTGSLLKSARATAHMSYDTKQELK
jgi:hypothetical protein